MNVLTMMLDALHNGPYWLRLVDGEIYIEPVQASRQPRAQGDAYGRRIATKRPMSVRGEFLEPSGRGECSEERRTFKWQKNAN